jgi:hypothetical protein
VVAPNIRFTEPDSPRRFSRWVAQRADQAGELPLLLDDRSQVHAQQVAQRADQAGELPRFATKGNRLINDLLSVFRHLEQQSLPALVRFADGSAYELGVISTAHAEAGGDVVADVLRVVSPKAAGGDWSGACMNFLLSDVMQVTAGGQCAYLTARPAEREAAPDRPGE